jgi:hypothetical protein
MTYLKARLTKLEQHQALRDRAEDSSESLSPFEQYMRLINAPIKTIKTIKSDKPKPRLTYTPEEAYAVLIGKAPELS